MSSQGLKKKRSRADHLILSQIRSRNRIEPLLEQIEVTCQQAREQDKVTLRGGKPDASTQAQQETWQRLEEALRGKQKAEQKVRGLISRLKGA